MVGLDLVIGRSSSRPPFLLLLLLLLLLFLACDGKKKKKQSPRGRRLAVLRGLSLTLDPTLPSSVLFSRWASSLSLSGGSVSHVDAVSREQYVVAQINAGVLPPTSYHDYQRFAAGTGNVDSVRLLLNYGIATSLQTTTHEAFKVVRTCSIPGIRRLLKKSAKEGVDLLRTSILDDGTNLIHAATFAGCQSILQLLLEAAKTEGTHDDNDETTNIDSVALNGLTPAMIAATRGHTAILELLVQHGADIHIAHKFAGNNAAHFAAEMDQTRSIEMLCRLAGNKTEAMRLSHARTSSIFTTPCHIAAQSNASAATIHALVHHCHADVNALLNNDTTPLYLAAQEGHLDAIRGLLRAGADVHFAMPTTDYTGSKSMRPVNGMGKSDDFYSTLSLNSEAGNGAQAIHVASENGHHLALQILLDEGRADGNSLTIGVSPLHLAVQYDRRECARVLLSRSDVDVNIRSKLDGSTPLTSAAGRGRLEIAAALVEAGADIELTSRRGGGTPLLHAILGSHTELVELFLRECQKKGESGEAAQRTLFKAGIDGLTPLAAALAIGSSVIVSQLLSCLPNNGRDLLVPTGSEGAPWPLLLLAAKAGHNHLITDLLVRGHDANAFVTVTRDNNEYRATPLLLAVEVGCTTCVPNLLRGGARAVPFPFIKSHLESPLLRAIDLNRVEIVSLLLLEAGAETGAADAGGEGTLQDPLKGVYQNPLLLAVVRGRAAIVTLLLQHGARCDIFIATSADTSKTSSLVDLARQKRSYDVLQALLGVERCADIDKQPVAVDEL